ncbi:hypothetical protein [Dactylosporangium sp. CS-033363]|uniref:hypothetical protein n=1 Tax=Dactylosporangium sp. CS-033363 TaxID=3239935 RepID=UPI003D8B0271
MAVGRLAALGCAALAAVLYGLSSLLQATGAKRAASLMRVVRQPWYVAGVALDLLAWLLSVVALRSLPVYQVQAVLAASLAVTVVAARFFLGVRLRRVDGVAVAAIVAALVVLAISSGPLPPVHASVALRAGLLAAAAVVAALGYAMARSGRAAACAAVAGLGFGGAALAVQAVAVPPSPVRPKWLLALATDPAVWALAVFAVAGALLYARSLEAGDPSRVTAVLWVVEVVAPSAVGVALFGETVRAGWEPAAVLALLAAVAAAAVLAKNSAHRVLEAAR